MPSPWLASTFFTDWIEPPRALLVRSISSSELLELVKDVECRSCLDNIVVQNAFLRKLNRLVDCSSKTSRKPRFSDFDKIFVGKVTYEDGRRFVLPENRAPRSGELDDKFLHITELTVVPYHLVAQLMGEVTNHPFAMVG